MIGCLRVCVVNVSMQAMQIKRYSHTSNVVLLLFPLLLFLSQPLHDL